jgi:hypothetical protein
VTAAGGLEAGYRRLLRWYPRLYRRRHEEEILGVLMATAQPGQQRPGARDSLDLLRSALKIRIRVILRGENQPWAAALALVAVLIPLLMLLLRLTLFLYQGSRYGFGSPADMLIGGYGQPGSFAQTFQLNPNYIAVPSVVTEMLTAGPVPVLILAGLVCLGWRRTAAVFAAFVPLAVMGVELASGYTLLGGPYTAITLYTFGLEALALLITSDAPRGWRALRWRPGALLAAVTVAAGLGMSGGLWYLFHGRQTISAAGLGGLLRARALFRLRAAGRPNAFVAFIDRLFGVGPGSGWGDWLLYQGTLVAVIVVALTILLVSSPVNRRAVYLLGIPFALGLVIYLCSLTSLPGPVGNAVTAVPLLVILLAAMAVPLVYKRRANPDLPTRPTGA